MEAGTSLAYINFFGLHAKILILSRKSQEVGSKGMPALINVLNQDRNDIDTTKAAVDTITILCSTEYNTVGMQILHFL